MLMNCHGVHMVPHNDILERKRTRKVHMLLESKEPQKQGNQIRRILFRPQS